MLGGLLHNIGALPILARIEQLGADVDDQLIDRNLAEFAPEVGTLVMEGWAFPSSLAAIPRGCLDLQRDSGPQVDYVDIVLAARLQHLLAMDRVDVGADWARVPAFTKLGIQVEVIVLDEAGPAAWIDDVKSVLHA